MSFEKRRKLLLDPEIRGLIEIIIKRNPSELKPVFDYDKGFHFKEIDEITGDVKKSKSILKKLEDSKILEKKLYDRTIVCPNCGSWSISLRYHCPSCNKTNFEHKRLIEHIKCGLIDSLDRFWNNDELECPRCRAKLYLEHADVRNIGTWFQCSSCDTRFDDPVISQYCRSCDEKFTVRDAGFESVFLYVLSDGVKAEYERGLKILSPLRKELEKLKYNVKTLGSLEGKSGTDHRFDLIAWKDDEKKPIVFDIILSEHPINMTPITSMFAKIYDVNPERQILVAIPNLENESLKLAKLYKIEVLEAMNIEEGAEKVVKLMSGSKKKKKKG